MKCRNIDVNIICDYICYTFFKDKEGIPVAKLQKLLYYTQAWYLARNDEALFKDDFEAWKHGPTCPVIQARFKHKLKSVSLTKKDIDLARLESIPADVEQHINTVLDYYGELTFLELEEYFVQIEEPWRKARGELRGSMRGSTIIKKEEMLEFHRSMDYSQKPRISA